MTDRMTNAEIVALCEAFDKASKPDSLMVAFAPAMFAKALTAIRQLQQPWQGIESAPKDGTRVDLFVHFPSGGVRWADARWLESGQHACHGPADWCSSEIFPLHAFTEKPTAMHWMALPALTGGQP